MNEGCPKHRTHLSAAPKDGAPGNGWSASTLSNKVQTQRENQTPILEPREDRPPVRSNAVRNVIGSPNAEGAILQKMGRGS
jgi:hypothetical protein